MWDLYLISRIGALHVALCGLAAIFLVAAFFCFMFSLPSDGCSRCGNCSEKEDAMLRHWSKNLTIAGLIFLIGTILTPTKEQAYLIYGVGGTVDYIKSNDKAKQIPDKAVDALNRYLDSIENKDK